MDNALALKSPLAQNRIDYIVYSQPDKTRELIEAFGFEPPEREEDLAEAVKFLIRKHGLKAVKKLLEFHPDRKALLSLHSRHEDNYCNACSSFSYNPEEGSCSCGHSNYTGDNRAEFLEKLEKKKLSEVETLYQNLLKQSNQHPEDKVLAEELQLVWNRLRGLRETAPKEKKDKPQQAAGFWQGNKVYTIGSLILIAGILVGTSLQLNWKKMFSHASA